MISAPEPLSFKSIDSYQIGYLKITVYTVANPTDCPRQELQRFIGQTVLIDGVSRKIYGVESFALGGMYLAGKPVGLAVKDEP